MPDLATLILQVDSGQVEQARKRLDALYASGAITEKQAQSLLTASIRMTAGMAVAGKAASDLGDRTKNLNLYHQSLGERMVGLTSIILRLAATYSVVSLAQRAFEEASSFQRTQAELEVLVGNVEQANDLMKELDDLSRRVSGGFDRIGKSAEQLLLAGANAKDLPLFLNAIVDATNALGGSQEKMNAITSLFGQIVDKGIVGTREMRQLAGLGIPAWKALGEAIGVTDSQLKQLVEKGMVEGVAAIRVISEAIESRPREAANKAFETVSGKFRLLGIAITRDLREAGLAVDESPGLSNFLSKAIENAERFGPLLSDTIRVLAGMPAKFAENQEAAEKLAEAIKYVGVVLALITAAELINGLIRLANTFGMIASRVYPLSVALLAITAIPFGSYLQDQFQVAARAALESSYIILMAVEKIKSAYRDITSGKALQNAKTDLTTTTAGVGGDLTAADRADLAASGLGSTLSRSEQESLMNNSRLLGPSTRPVAPQAFAVSPEDALHAAYQKDLDALNAKFASQGPKQGFSDYLTQWLATHAFGEGGAVPMLQNVVGGFMPHFPKQGAKDSNELENEAPFGPGTQEILKGLDDHKLVQVTAQQNKFFDDMIKKIGDENELLGKGVDEREKIKTLDQFDKFVHDQLLDLQGEEFESLRKMTAERRKQIEALEDERKVLVKIDTISRGIGDALGDSITDFLTNVKDAKAAVEDLFKSVERLLVQQLVSKPIADNAASALFSIGKGLFGHGDFGAGASTAGGDFAKGAAFWMGNVVPFANGGITNGPTYFPMSGGRMGLMGEKDPGEGILPLARGSDGSLGVRVHGGGGQTIHNHYYTASVTVQANNPAEFKRSERQIGNRLAQGFKRMRG